MSLKEGLELNITNAEWVSEYVLNITFSDGCSRKVDLGRFLKDSVHPEIRKYLALDMFKAFSISFGNLMWNDYDLCFSIEDLYSGIITDSGESDRMVAENRAQYRAGNEAGK
jgi:hypothetical protein